MAARIAASSSSAIDPTGVIVSTCRSLGGRTARRRPARSTPTVSACSARRFPAGTVRLIEIRLLEGPNVYRLEPVVKIEVALGEAKAWEGGGVPPGGAAGALRRR